MNLIVLISGLVLLALCLWDLSVTCLSPAGAGPLTRTVSRTLWSIALAMHRRWDSHRCLEAAAMPILLVILLGWVLLAWAGWSLVFGAASDFVVTASDPVRPADWLERVYFAGYTISTLGLGDFVAGRPEARLLTPVATLTGWYVITLSITYFLQVIGANNDKHRLAINIGGLGNDLPSLTSGLARAVDEGSSIPVQIADQLALHTLRHRHYPVIHYFHSGNPQWALLPKLTCLDIALHRLARSHGDAPGYRQLRHSLDQFIAMFEARFAQAATDAAALPDLGNPRARLWTGLLVADGWDPSHPTLQEKGPSS